MAPTFFAALLVTLAASQSIMQIFSFHGGLPNCANCGNVTDYACSSGTVGHWNGGQFTFKDPVPAGQYVLEARVLFMGAYGCESGFQSNMSATIQGTPIGVVTAQSNGELCKCNACDGGSGFCRRNYYQGFPNYNYGGTNTFQVLVGSDPACLHTVTLELDYGPLTPLPKNTIYLDLEPTNVNSNNRYYTSMGICYDYREPGSSVPEYPNWPYNFTFNDPIPSGTILITVGFSFYGGVWNEDSSSSQHITQFPYSLSMGTVTYNNGNANITWGALDQLTCEPEAQTSITYQIGWPGYNYGGQNSMQLDWYFQGGQNYPYVCVTRGELLLTYYTPGEDDEVA